MHCAHVLSQTHSPPTNDNVPRHASQTVELEHELHVSWQMRHCPLSKYVGSMHTLQIISKLLVSEMQVVHPG